MVRIFILFIGLFLILSTKAADVVCFDSNTKVVTKFLKSVHTPNYINNSNCLIDPTLPNGDSKYWIYDVNASELREMSSNEKDTFYLEGEKNKKKEEINERTRGLILEGFSFDGETFSLNEEAKINWTNLAIAKNVLSYPVEISVSNGDTYTLENPLAIDNFYGTGLSTIRTLYDSAKPLKEAVDNCNSLACLESIVDNR